MGKKRLIFALAAAMAVLVPCGCRQGDDGLDHHDHGHSGHHDEHADCDGHDHDGHDHEGHAGRFGQEIVLEPEVAERFGVETDTVRPGDFHQVIRVTGRIVDNPASASVVSAPTAGILRYAPGVEQGSDVRAGAVVATISSEGVSGGDSDKADRAALDAASRELERLKPLYEEGIVTARDYNAALEAYELARSRYSSAAASGTARAAGAGVVSQLLAANGQYVEAGAPIATIAANRRLTLRADVPDRHSASLPLIDNAAIMLPSASEPIDLSLHGGARVSGADASRLSPGYIPVFFTFDNQGLTLPGTLVDVYLTGAPRSGVITVPREAVVEQQGRRFVYVKVDEEGYLKVPVTLGDDDGCRIEVVSGLEPGDCVVVKGATAVRLAESSGAVPEGHSHSH